MTSVHGVKGEVCVVGFIFKFRAPTKEVKLQMEGEEGQNRVKTKTFCVWCIQQSCWIKYRHFYEVKGIFYLMKKGGKNNEF